MLKFDQYITAKSEKTSLKKCYDYAEETYATRAGQIAFIEESGTLQETMQNKMADNTNKVDRLEEKFGRMITKEVK